MRYQTSTRVQQLQAQFPELQHIIPRFKRGDGPQHRIRILVQRADPAFLYTYAETADGERSHCEPLPKETHLQGCIATRYKHLFFVLPDGTIDSQVTWEDFHASYCIDFLRKRKHLLPTLSRVVVLAVLTWYKRQDPLTTMSYLGAYQSTDLEITIHQAPTCGWSELVATTDLSKNVPMGFRDLIVAGCRYERPDVRRYNDALTEIATLFSTQVYANGLKTLIDASKIAGMSGMFNGVELMSWVSAGRIPMTVQRGNIDVTFKSLEGEYYEAGVHSMHGTVEEVRALVNDLVAGWTALSQEQRASQYKDNKNVSMF